MSAPTPAKVVVARKRRPDSILAVPLDVLVDVFARGGRFEVLSPLPNGACLEGVHYDEFTDSLVFRVESDAYFPVPDDDLVPRNAPIIRRLED